MLSRALRAVDGAIAKAGASTLERSAVLKASRELAAAPRAALARTKRKTRAPRWGLGLKSSFGGALCALEHRACAVMTRLGFD